MSEEKEFESSEIYKSYAQDWIGDVILLSVLVGILNTIIVFVAPELVILSVIITVAAILYAVYGLFKDINRLIVEHTLNLEEKVTNNGVNQKKDS